MLLDGELVELRRGTSSASRPRSCARFAAGPDGLEIVAVGGPKPEGGDGEQASVAWPDLTITRPG